jgi:hypothetical protein
MRLIFLSTFATEDIFFVRDYSGTLAQLMSSLCHLRALCASVVDNLPERLTTETQSTQRVAQRNQIRALPTAVAGTGRSGRMLE